MILLTNYHDKETLIKAYDQDGKIHSAQANKLMPN
jgi:hypothetical protein